MLGFLLIGIAPSTASWPGGLSVRHLMGRISRSPTWPRPSPAGDRPRPERASEGRMSTRRSLLRLTGIIPLALLAAGLTPSSVSAADKLVGIYAARVMSQSLPWIAREAGLFPRYGLDFELKYIASSAMVTAAMLSGEAEVGLVGSVGIIQAVVKGGARFCLHRGREKHP